MKRHLFSVLLCLVCPAISYASQNAALVVVVEKDAPKLEQLAAEELKTQLARLFETNVEIRHKMQGRFFSAILVGSPRTNSTVQAIVAETWPKLSEQGIVVRSFRNKDWKGVIVGGNSPTATLWAAYELGHQLGIRYHLRGDLFPKTPLSIGLLEKLHIEQQPNFNTRGWRLIGDSPLGSQSWGLAEHRQFLKRLARMKFNRITLDLHPWQPFVDYEFAGIKKTTAHLWRGKTFRVDGDTPGRAAFAGKRVFENPDFSGQKNSSEMSQAGRKYIRGIITAAHDLGMSVELSISPFGYPKEFAGILEPLKRSEEDPTLIKFAKTKLRAYLKTYPTVDAISLSVSAETNQRPASATLIDLTDLLKDKPLLQTATGRTVDVVVTGIPSALFSVSKRDVPKNAAPEFALAATVGLSTEMLQKLSKITSDDSNKRFRINVSNEASGILSQSPIRGLEQIVGRICEAGANGFTVECFVLGELDESIHYLSRVSFDSNLTAEAAHTDFFAAIMGKVSPAERLWRGMNQIAEAGSIIEQNDPKLVLPAEKMLMRYDTSEPAPEWAKDISDKYTQALIEMYRSRGASDARAKGFMYYYAKRAEYVTGYLTAVQAVRDAAAAKKSGDMEKTIEHLETAVEALYDALDTLGDVAYNQSDRGLIAVLNAYAFRPLLAEYERLLDAADSEN